MVDHNQQHPPEPVVQVDEKRRGLQKGEPDDVKRQFWRCWWWWVVTKFYSRGEALR